MCGIAGWVAWGKNISKEKDVLNKMAQTLIPRGPDAEGVWASDDVGLVHRRLIVIDPMGGAQPMIRSQGKQKIILVYNGELYNAQDLREQLQKKGFVFEGHCDTEVLLLSYMAWGIKCIEYLNGIYAFAIWDTKEKILFAARDRMGVKPFFYTHKKNQLIFGSEIKTLLAHPQIKPVIDGQGLSEIFLAGPARTPGCGVFKDIYELRPGHVLIYNQKGLNIQRYWQPQNKEHRDDFKSTLYRVRTLVLDAIRRQLVSDVPICCFLSGGLDSSAITAVAAKQNLEKGKEKLSTYEIDYKDNNKYFKESIFQPNEDAPWAERMARHLDAHHQRIVLGSDELIGALKAAMIARDVPGMADVDSSLYLFCKRVKKQATVALSGECADEVFGGYPWYYRDEMLNASGFPWSQATAERAGLLSNEVLQYIEPKEYMQQRYHQTLDEIEMPTEISAKEKRMKQMFYINLTWFMTTLLDRKDRMSMASGLEVRVPFCDHRIVEYLWNIPWEMKYYKNREKGLLREALRGILPEDVLWRKKSPYPKTHHPNYYKQSKNLLQHVLNDKNAKIQPLINKKAIQQMLDTEGASFGKPWFGQLMASAQIFAYLAQVDMWLNEYKVSVV